MAPLRKPQNLSDSFYGKVAVVTGSSKGIGRAVAEKLGAARANVVINARKEDELAITEKELREQGFEVFGFAANVADDDGPESLVAAAADRYGPIDFVVNMVAINPAFGPLLGAEKHSFAKTMVVNTWSPVAVVQAAVSHGLTDGGGAVVNVSTIGARQYQPWLAAYCASKAALEVVTTHLANELGPLGVRVNTVAPGLTKTDMARVLWEGRPGEFEKSVLPLGRLGSPDEIADGVVFLLSDRASWITGTTLSIDGGRLVTSLTFDAANGR
jgi:3-oxoacyl-[acyl-carrier protein] reductase